MFKKLLNKAKKSIAVSFFAVSSFVFGSFAMAQTASTGSAAMTAKVEQAVTANSSALWTVGGSVIVLAVIGLIIRKIRAQAS